MELTPWRQLGDLSSVRREMDRLWDRFLGESSLLKKGEKSWIPSVNVSETKDSIQVKAELPGVESKDVSVTLLGDMLTIKGEKKQEKEEKDEHHHVVENYYGSFERSFKLPEGVQPDKVDASFDKGVLKITLPKTEESKKKEINIRVK